MYGTLALLALGPVPCVGLGVGYGKSKRRFNGHFGSVSFTSPNNKHINSLYLKEHSLLSFLCQELFAPSARR